MKQCHGAGNPSTVSEISVRSSTRLLLHIVVSFFSAQCLVRLVTVVVGRSVSGIILMDARALRAPSLSGVECDRPTNYDPPRSCSAWGEACHLRRCEFLLTHMPENLVIDVSRGKANRNQVSALVHVLVSYSAWLPRRVEENKKTANIPYIFPHSQDTHSPSQTRVYYPGLHFAHPLYLSNIATPTVRLIPTRLLRSKVGVLHPRPC